MAYNIKDYFTEVSAGNAGADAEAVHKFGHNDSVGTTYVPIAVGGVYQTPQFNAAVTLRIKAGGNANDTAGGTGARVICLEGLDENGEKVNEDVVTAGASASASTTATFTRLYRAFVKESGTYATSSAGSHAASITIEKTAGSEDWATIELEGFAQAQTQIAAYTVPAGKMAYIKQLYVSVLSTKRGSLILFQRPGAEKITAPYDGMRMLVQMHNISGDAHFDPQMPLGPFKEFTDIGVLGKFNQGTGEMDVDFEILLRDAE
jgi:hypothetical protein